MQWQVNYKVHKLIYPATSLKNLEVKIISVGTTTLFHQGALKLAEQGSPLNLLDHLAAVNDGRYSFFALHPILQHLHSDYEEAIRWAAFSRMGFLGHRASLLLVTSPSISFKVLRGHLQGSSQHWIECCVRSKTLHFGNEISPVDSSSDYFQ